MNLLEQQTSNRRRTWLVMVVFVGFLLLLGLGFDRFFLGVAGPVPVGSLLALGVGSLSALTMYFAGDRAVLLPFKGHLVSIAICYEIVYPAIAREFVLGGSELLTTITNDAWFGQTSAPYQHFAQASMRAIEEGRYLVRAANTGISGIVDPYGRIVEESTIFQPAVIVGSVRLVGNPTLYSRVGDAFAYLSAVLTLALLVAARRRVQ